MLLFDKEPAPALVPTYSPERSSMLWRVTHGVGVVVSLALLLAGALLVGSSLLSGCTIQEITLYKTVNQAQPRATPIAKIGPS